MAEKGSKCVGEVFRLLLNREKEAREKLFGLASLTTYAENAIWNLWRLHDPVTAVDMVRRRQVKEETGKWPKMEPYSLKKTPDGLTPTKIAGALCPGVASMVYDAIANAVAKGYMKKRCEFLTFSERLPVAKDLRIRFRAEAVRIRRNPVNPEWFQVGLAFWAPKPRHVETEWVDILTGVGRKSPATMAWLADVADGKATTSGGVISTRRVKGKVQWQITQARERRVAEEGGHAERAKVEPLPDRELVCSAPLDNEEFMICEVEGLPGRPWRFVVESNDFIVTKKRNQRHRVAMGANYHQSPENAAHGHGRRRAMQAQMEFRRRYEARVRDWIENRSMAIVRFAIESRCGVIKFENLTKLDPKDLRLGSFPYFQFITRTQQKAKDAGIKFVLLEPLPRRLAV